MDLGMAVRPSPLYGCFRRAQCTTRNDGDNWEQDNGEMTTDRNENEAFENNLPQSRLVGLKSRMDWSKHKWSSRYIIFSSFLLIHITYILISEPT